MRDTPAERGRDELREKIEYALERCTRDGYRSVGVGLTADDARRILALLAPQEAREPEAIERPCGCEDAGRLRFTAREWLRAWHKAGVRELLAAARPAPETREPELLGYVVERQLTTGEWMRVWRGSTLWFDHDEAVLDRNAYALDGIPARIRPVYLGAPAPAEATTRERKALDEIWEIASMADQSDPAFSAWGALETIAEIVRGFDEVEDQCDECGVMRSQGEGGTTFTVCDACWDKLHGAAEATERSES